MSRRVHLIAPAKVNWSLEVLRIRPDGYHEIRSVLQTIDLCDELTLAEADDITLVLMGDAGPLGDDPVEANLAYRAAVALRDRAGLRRGARITLEKRIPVAAGLGGGSSDAAAVLRGLDVLWETKQPPMNLIEIAGEIGSDPPFFVVGGTAAVSGRGERVEALADAVAPPIVLATPRRHHRGEKTAQMFGALTPDDYADGYVTIGVREIVRAGRVLVDADLNNVFERVTGQLQPETELAMDALRADGLTPHLAGAGPSFFLLCPDAKEVPQAFARRISDLGFEPRFTRTMTRESALALREP